MNEPITLLSAPFAFTSTDATRPPEGPALEGFLEQLTAAAETSPRDKADERRVSEREASDSSEAPKTENGSNTESTSASDSDEAREASDSQNEPLSKEPESAGEGEDSEVLAGAIDPLLIDPILTESPEAQEVVIEVATLESDSISLQPQAEAAIPSEGQFIEATPLSGQISSLTTTDAEARLATEPELVDQAIASSDETLTQQGPETGPSEQRVIATETPDPSAEQPEGEQLTFAPPKEGAQGPAEPVNEKAEPLSSVTAESTPNQNESENGESESDNDPQRQTTTVIPEAETEAASEAARTATTVDRNGATQTDAAAARIDPATADSPLVDRAAAAERATPGESPQVDPARFVSRVSRAFETAQQRGGGPIEIRLSPPELGAMQLKIEVKEGVLTASIETETHAARNALLDNLPALRDRLAEQQIRVEKFDVDVRDESGSGRGDENSGGQEPRDREANDSPRTPADTRRDNTNRIAADRQSTTPTIDLGDDRINLVA